MKIYLNRFLGYLFLSLSFALAFGLYDGNPFSKPYHYNSLDRHASEEERDVGHEMQKLIPQGMELMHKEMELRQQTKKIMAAQMALEQKFENKRMQEENSPQFIKKVQLKRRLRFIRYILAAVFLLSGFTLIRV